jgi:hypothetical protein
MRICIQLHVKDEYMKANANQLFLRYKHATKHNGSKIYTTYKSISQQNRIQRICTPLIVLLRTETVTNSRYIHCQQPVSQKSFKINKKKLQLLFCIFSESTTPSLSTKSATPSLLFCIFPSFVQIQDSPTYTFTIFFFFDKYIYVHKITNNF